MLFYLFVGLCVVASWVFILLIMTIGAREDEHRRRLEDQDSPRDLYRE